MKKRLSTAHYPSSSSGFLAVLSLLNTTQNKPFRENGACWVIRIRASRVNSASEWKFVDAAVSRSSFSIWSKFLHWFWGKFFLSYLSVTLNCLETFWDIKKLEENNHRFASALASTSFFLTWLLSLLFVYSGNWNYSLNTWRHDITGSPGNWVPYVRGGLYGIYTTIKIRIRVSRE